ncbi:hypothetical protein NMS70_003123 [Vibrio cholerae]|nr:hypothetical protein [Vibrio cholerae]
MFKEPFKVLYNKFPFFEFIVRMVYLLLFPNIERSENLSKGPMKYALWDICLCVSLMATSVIVIDIFSGSTYEKMLSIFNNEFVVFLEFGYYAFCYTFIFFLILICCLFLIKKLTNNKEIKVAHYSYICSMQYARVYSLIMFLFFPIVLFALDLSLTVTRTMKSFVGEHIFSSWGVMLFFAVVYGYCLVRPIKKYLFPNKTRLIYPLMMVFTLSPMFFSGFIPNIFNISLNNKIVYEIVLNKNKISQCK